MLALNQHRRTTPGIDRMMRASTCLLPLLISTVRPRESDVAVFGAALRMDFAIQQFSTFS